MSQSSQAKYSDKDILDLFVETANNLLSTRLVKSRQLFSYSTTIKWDEKLGLEQKAGEIDEDDLRSFLVVFRPFTSEKEPQYFYKTYNIAFKLLKPEHHTEKQRIAQAREGWAKGMKRVNGIKINILGQEFSPEYVLDLFINGHYFHSDPELRLQLRELSKLPIRLDKMSFIMTLQDLTHVIKWTGNFVAYGLNNYWFEFP